MAFFPRFPAGEFSPLFRLLDDYSQHAASRESPLRNVPLQSFQPRFDVKESKDAYELHGEFPGIDQKDISIEFTDASTLTVSGRTERSFEQGTRPQALEANKEPAQIESGATSAHKATVEDEPEASDQVESKSSEIATTGPKQAGDSEAGKYWISERSIGQFSRTFSFPSRVDQEAVKASLKNGILSIVVPKAQIPANRRISIE